MSTTQVLILNSLRTKDWPIELKPWLLSRCSAATTDYDYLHNSGYVSEATGRIELTLAGKRKLRAEKATHRHAV